MVSQALFSSNTEEWYTPQDFFEKCEKEVGLFNLDPCATPENTKCKYFYTKEENGLTKEWFGNVWVNPPYGRVIYDWVAKCSRERESRGNIPSHTFSNGYKILSRVSIQSTRRRTPIHSVKAQIRMSNKLRTISIITSNF